MKIRLPTLLLALLLLTSPCYAGGIAPDKQKHIGVAAGMNLAMETMGVKKSTRYTILGVVFVGKEIYDHNKEHSTHDHVGDIVADIGGVAISEGVIWIVHKKF
jgi:hypothetical protein